LYFFSHGLSNICKNLVSGIGVDGVIHVVVDTAKDGALLVEVARAHCGYHIVSMFFHVNGACWEGLELPKRIGIASDGTAKMCVGEF